jgi:hypothetical protein
MLMLGGNDRYACNTENENCMYGLCTSCPGAETLKVLFQNELDDITVAYKQWVVTDRATLMTAT